MKAKIVGVPTNYVNVEDGISDHDKVIEGAWSVELVVTDAEETKDQVLDWYRDGVEFDLVPREEMMADQVQMDPAEARRQTVAQLRELADRIEANERDIKGFTITTRRHDDYNYETVFRIAEIVTESERRAYLEAGGR